MEFDTKPAKKIVRVSGDTLRNVRFLRPLRDSQNLKQQDIADIANLTQKTVSNTETHFSKPQWETVVRILWALGGNILLELPEETCFYVEMLEDEETP